MKKKIFFLFILILSSKTLASEKNNIIQNFKSIENLTFNFEQNINGKIENGFCTIKYPKKIFCKYDLENKKVLVSNGKSRVGSLLDDIIAGVFEISPPTSKSPFG